MNGHRISIAGSLEGRLKSWLTGHPDGYERGALVLFRKMERTVLGLPPSARFLAVDVIEMDGDWVLESSLRTCALICASSKTSTFAASRSGSNWDSPIVTQVAFWISRSRMIRTNTAF